MYILVEFGDQDFTYNIREGIQHVYDEDNSMRCPTIIKGLIVGHVVGEALKDYAISPNGYSYDTPMDYANSIYGYIDASLRVTMEKHKPPADKEFGDSSYGLDINTGYIWHLG